MKRSSLRAEHHRYDFEKVPPHEHRSRYHGGLFWHVSGLKWVESANYDRIQVIWKGQHRHRLLFFSQTPRELNIIVGLVVCARCLREKGRVLFIYPGLLSDIIAWVLLIPRFQKSFSDSLLDGLKKEAEKQGKSLEQLLKPKCSI